MRQRTISVIICLFLYVFMPASLFPDGKEILILAEKYYENHEYFYAITETKRYSLLYPEGDFKPDILLLQGKAYLRGGNYGRALTSFNECLRDYPGTAAGEKALYMAGHARMVYGSVLFATRELDSYLTRYPEGLFMEEAQRDICYASILSNDLHAARVEIGKYMANHPEGKYIDELKEVDKMITDEINRPRKSAAVSLGGSLVLPGFGHFYTGKTKEGFLALATTSLFLYLTVDGINSGDRFRTLFFGFITLNFYQHSLSASISNVQKYNSPANLNHEIKMRITGRF